MIMIGIGGKTREKNTIARYPFLPEAFEMIKDESIEEILYSETFRRSRALAVARVQSALRNDEKQIFVDERNCFEAVLSFYLSKAIVTHIKDNFLLRRHSIFEAKNAYYYLEKESGDVVDQVAKSLGIEREGDRIGFTTFLKYAPNSYGSWKLVNTKLSDGMVEIDKHSFLRILQEAMRERIEKIRFTVSGIDKAIDLGSVYAELSSRKIAQRKAYRIEFDSFPPCMRNIIAQIESNINVSHLGRFSLVAFLNGIGMKEEEIIKVLMPTPDFDDRIARYQVEHITGKEYSAPSCDSMRTYSLCFEPDNLCAKIKHPMQYYEYKINHKGHGRVPSKEV